MTPESLILLIFMLPSRIAPKSYEQETVAASSSGFSALPTTSFLTLTVEFSKDKSTSSAVTGSFAASDTEGRMNFLIPYDEVMTAKPITSSTKTLPKDIALHFMTRRNTFLPDF